MNYLATADTDIGISKEINQDSILVKHADSEMGEIVLAVVCDGMGGLSKGELASATVIREFSDWFEQELPYELEDFDLQVMGGKWSLMIKEVNGKLLEYGRNIGVSIGTTVTGMLIINNQYLIGHVGDTRVYHISSKLRQLTVDQTFVEREVSRGVLTLEQAKTDRRRNMLLQCVGASEKVEPDILVGACEKGVYVLVLLFPVPGSNQVYCQGYDGGPGINDPAQHHSPSSFFVTDENGNLILDADGNAQIIQISEDESATMLHEFTTFVIHNASEDDKALIISYVSGLLAMTFGDGADIDAILDYALSDTEALTTVLAYLVKYMDEYDLDARILISCLKCLD